MFSELTEALQATGYAVYDTDVPETPALPYVVVWGGAAAPHGERCLADRMIGVRDRLGITTAAGTPEGARIAHQRVRAIVQPDGFPASFGGFQVRLTDHQPVQVDRAEKITGTNRHPAYCVDIFVVEK